MHKTNNKESGCFQRPHKECEDDTESLRVISCDAVLTRVVVRLRIKVLPTRSRCQLSLWMINSQAVG